MFHFKCTFIVIVLYLLFSPLLKAEQLEQHVDLFEFHTIELQQRAVTLAKALRCPQCQNQNLVESNAQAAKDLRLKVYSMVNDGSTEQEVKDYLVKRYGNIVLYHPPFNYSTAALWIFPALFVICFALFSIKKIRPQ
ncbi:cytochrome c-type biogenesis protein CcmH [Vibrio sp. J1-1]|uniref:cytochrome c-type biogenesis protein CcmH n=1 Tax=Vibrio sp. J1-1 TaxID=2912251 RepID=UPI001F1FC4A8|nr:cytochrome c-type biogenesis protein CcmH [Vibrio sp. J1-1]MBR9876189.1 heme lyase NrfEFG subunit NrfF [Vibrionaceae bacterium]MCF7482293.1 cytochrome c-type biogenesis protein CcmH [Vibrio sp. J1-1]